MKNCLIVVVLLGLLSCSKDNPTSKPKASLQDNQIQDSLMQNNEGKDDVVKVSFKKVDEQAVLIGDQISLLDSNLEIVSVLSNLTGKIFSIKGVSDSLFNKGEDICDAFWYVEIQNDSLEGIINGRQVFKLLGSNNLSKTQGDSIQIFRTEFYAIGVSYDGDLLGCSVDQPVVIRDIENNYFGLVTLSDNSYSQEASYEKEFQFFELVDNEGGYDEIEFFGVEDKEIKLNVHRSFQEGENNSDVLLEYKAGNYVAEYLNFGEVEYK